MEQLEAEAREAKRGLWADTNPVPPWDFPVGDCDHPAQANSSRCAAGTITTSRAIKVRSRSAPSAQQVQVAHAAFASSVRSSRP